MKKMRFIVVFLFLPILIFGCDLKDSYYFKFNFESLSVTIGSIINIFEEDIDTNLEDFSQLKIFSSNDLVAEVVNNTLEVKSLGSSTIIVSGVVDNETITDNFTLNVVDSLQIQNTKELSIVNYCKIEQDSYDVYNFDVKLNDNYCLDFIYQIIENESSLYEPINKLNSNLTVKCNKGESLKLKIYDKDRTVFIYVNLPSD